MLRSSRCSQRLTSETFALKKPRRMIRRGFSFICDRLYFFPYDTTLAMVIIKPYINFNGNAEKAFIFYKLVFGGEFFYWDDLGRVCAIDSIPY